MRPSRICGGATQGGRGSGTTQGGERSLTFSELQLSTGFLLPPPNPRHSGARHESGRLGHSSPCWQVMAALWDTTHEDEFPGGSVINYPPANAKDTGDSGFIPWVGKIL